MPGTEEIFFSHAHFPVTALGWGQRVGVWLQGCSIRCVGCVAPQTWEVSEHHRTSVGALVDALGPWLRRADGLTISGGEPFDQLVALQALLRRCRPAVTGDILIYTGHPWLAVSQFTEILALVDAVIPEPYMRDRPSGDPLTGSANQRVTPLTELGRVRYGAARELHRNFDAACAPDFLRLAGVPRSGEIRSITRDVRVGRTVPLP